MLLKLGTGMMIFAVAFAAVVALMVNLSGADEPAASETAVKLRAAESPTEQEEVFDVGETLELDIEPREEPQAAETPVQDEPVIHEKVKTEKQPPLRPPEEPPTKPREETPLESPKETPPEPPEETPESSTDETVSISYEDDWPRPSREEVAAASKPRYYPWVEGAVFTLTIRALEIYNAPVLDSTSPEALANGVVHVPETPMPWDGGQQKNVYLAGHRVGVPGTTSRVLFYHLDKISVGDSVVLKDRSGNAYRYRVSEIFVVTPDDGWVLDPVRGRDMVTLQTCTYPTFENRFIVRADRI
ncbi:MAG: sortase [Chloroflexota bacterium]|jgi:sortase A|nr:sortase [Chloroflexota bacterium]